MQNLEFRQLRESDEQAYLDYIDQFVQAGEKVVPSSIYNQDLSFPEWFEAQTNISQGINLPGGWVPATNYFLFHKSDGRILGALDIRHELNDHLLNLGGNIGYGVATSERRKGYASFMLGEALKICRDIGMKRVLITCNASNVGSAKTIQKNGGVLENEVPAENGHLRQRYWIVL